MSRNRSAKSSMYQTGSSRKRNVYSRSSRAKRSSRSRSTRNKNTSSDKNTSSGKSKKNSNSRLWSTVLLVFASTLGAYVFYSIIEAESIGVFLEEIVSALRAALSSSKTSDL